MVTVLSSDLKNQVKERLEKRKEYIVGSFNIMVDSYNQMRRMLGSTYIKGSDGTEIVLSLPELDDLTPNYNMSADTRKRLQEKLSALKDRISDDKRQEVQRRMAVVNTLLAKVEQLLDSDVLGFILSEQNYTDFQDYKNAQVESLKDMELNVYDIKKVLDCLINDNEQMFDSKEELGFFKDAVQEVMSKMMDEEYIRQGNLPKAEQKDAQNDEQELEDYKLPRKHFRLGALYSEALKNLSKSSKKASSQMGGE